MVANNRNQLWLTYAEKEFFRKIISAQETGSKTAETCSETGRNLQGPGSRKHRNDLVAGMAGSEAVNGCLGTG